MLEKNSAEEFVLIQKIPLQHLSATIMIVQTCRRGGHFLTNSFVIYVRRYMLVLKF